MIRTIEENSMNAWPAAQTILLDGWVLRFSGGYTRRANCITALYPAIESLAGKLCECEALYRRQNLPVIFKLPGRHESADLDQFLAREGYTTEAETSVQTLDLRRWKADQSAEVLLSAEPTQEWYSAFSRMSGIAENNQAAHRQIVGAILAQTGFALLAANQQVVACGLGVIQNGWLGIFDIITAAEYRRRGYAEQIMNGLLGWASENGAHSAYLQVMLNNPPALALYARLGFREAYQYWYRVKR